MRSGALIRTKRQIDLWRPAMKARSRDDMTLETLLTADRLADKVLEIAGRMEHLARRFEELFSLAVKVLEQNTKAVAERAIHRELERYEQKSRGEADARAGRRGGGGFEIEDDGTGLRAP